MKLIYATRVTISAPSAQSLQVKSMSKAFFDLIGDDFTLIAFAKKGSLAPRSMRSFLIKYNIQSSILRQIIITVIALYKSIFLSRSIIYTRDIFVAFCATILNKSAVYESHRIPESIISNLLTSFFLKNRKSKLVVISAALGSAYQRIYKLEFEKILVAHDGVFIDRFKNITNDELYNLKKNLRLPDNKKLAIHTGSLYKGGAEIFEHIIKAGNENLIIIHVGGSDEEIKFWDNYYFKRGISDIVFLPTKSPEEIKLYQLIADLLIYINVRTSPIYWCTSPLKIFEYMATGKPILGSSIGSVAEIINDHNAFCFDPDDVSTIYSAVSDFISSASDASTRAKRAHKLVMASYTWERRAQRIVEFING